MHEAKLCVRSAYTKCPSSAAVHAHSYYVPFPDFTVDHSLIKTVPLLLDTLLDTLPRLDLVPVNVVLQNNPHAAKSRA